MTTLDASSSRKEIRRTLRIREGDALEIFTDAQGGVIFKKYSPVGEMSTFAGQYAEVLNKVTNRPVVMCDRDHVIAVAGVSKKEYLERRVSPELEEYMQNRMSYSNGDASEIRPVEGIDQAPPASSTRSSRPATSTARWWLLLQRDAGAQAGETVKNWCRQAAFFLRKERDE